MNNNNSTSKAARRAEQFILSYSIHTSAERDYSFFRIVLNQARPYGRAGDMQELATLGWQSNADSRADFYGLSLEARFSAFDGNMTKRSQELAKLLSKLDANGDSTPAQIIAKLESLKIPRTVYDSRVSRHVKIADLAPDDHVRFMDDWSRYGDKPDFGCTMSAIADTAENAAYAMRREWAKQLGDYPSESGAQRFAQWITAGCPVRRDQYSTAPTVIEFAA